MLGFQSLHVKARTNHGWWVMLGDVQDGLHQSEFRAALEFMRYNGYEEVIGNAIHAETAHEIPGGEGT